MSEEVSCLRNNVNCDCRIEALTASLCEKDANLALIQTTGPQNAASNQAIQKLNNEKETIQTQLRQLVRANCRTPFPISHPLISTCSTGFE